MVEGGNPLLVKCLNHCLELAIKDAYKKLTLILKTYNLFNLFKNSEKLGESFKLLAKNSI